MTIVGILVGIAGSTLTFVFTASTGIVKKLLSFTKKKKKKHDKIMMLAKNKLNFIEILMSQALNDLDVSHEEFVKIIREKDKYEEIKKNVKNDGMSKK